jgi:hypothetical protein
MAGESSIVRRALDRISNMGVLSPESRAVQADILKQRAIRYDKFMESVPGYKGMVNLAPNAAPVVRLENGAVAVLPMGAKIPAGAQVLNKTRSQIDDIVYNVPKEFSPEFVAGATAAIPAVPAALAAGAASGSSPAMPQPQDADTYPSTSPMGDVQTPSPATPLATRENYQFDAPYYGMGDTQPGAGYNAPKPEPVPYYGMDGSETSPTYGQQTFQPNEPRRFPEVSRALNVAGRGAAAPTAQTQERPSGEPTGIAALLRGRFGEAGKGSPMEDRLTAAQQERDRMGEGRASGGAVNGKDAALHKALEIIHHMISRK